MMEIMQLVVLKMKFDRYKVQYALSDDGKQCTIGHHKKNTKTRILSHFGNIKLAIHQVEKTLPIAMACAILTIQWSGFLPVEQEVTFTTSGFLIFYSMLSLLPQKVSTKGKQKIYNRRTHWTIQQGSIQFYEQSGIDAISFSDFEGIYTCIEDKFFRSNGQLWLCTRKGEKHLLLELRTIKHKYLKVDLNYIKNYLEFMLQKPETTSKTATGNRPN